MLLISEVRGCASRVLFHFQNRVTCVPGEIRAEKSSSGLLGNKCLYMHGMVYEYVCICMCVWSGHSLEGGTMAFLCSELQVAVETQSQTEPYWHTECRECRMLPPPSGDTGQNRAIVPEQLGAINAPRPPSVTNTEAQKHQSIHRRDIIYPQLFHYIIKKNEKLKILVAVLINGV